jgi:alanine dehydrogenase
MNIGVPREIFRHEHRVGLTPFGVSRLANRGHQVFVEHGAGEDSHFEDEHYAAAGASIVFRAEEVYQRSELVCRVSALAPAEVDLVRPGSVLSGFFHLAVVPREIVDRLAALEVSLLGYELVEDREGHRPLLVSFGEIAGHMVVHTAAHLLEHDSGGRGILLGGAPGIAPATVVILGAGTVGRTAARLFAAFGAHVIVLDAELGRLRDLMAAVPGNVVTAVASERNLDRFTAVADVLVGAVLIPGGRAPFLVTEPMVQRMKAGSVILDLSIDQGGCVETSRPTQPDNPTFELHGVTHYCVPNMTANLPRDASRALTLGALPSLQRLADEGLEEALRTDPGLGRGMYLYRGKVANEQTAQSLGLDYVPLSELLS